MKRISDPVVPTCKGDIYKTQKHCENMDTKTKNNKRSCCNIATSRQKSKDRSMNSQKYDCLKMTYI